jgi:hypothetical protein
MLTTAEYPTDLATEVTLLTPSMDLGERAHDEIVDIMDHGLVAATGLPELFAGSLATMSAEPHIVEYCPDRVKRFPTLAMTRKWHEKGRGFVAIYDVPANRGERVTEDQLDELTKDDMHLLAYGWSGEEPNHYIEGADITTAYRVGAEGSNLAFNRRRDETDKFKLGRPLGEIVLGTAVHIFGAEPHIISLETWESNGKAIGLYEGMNFVQMHRVEDTRPTLQPVGTSVNEHEVYQDQDKHGNLINKITDFRRAYLLGEAHPLRAAA